MQPLDTIRTPISQCQAWDSHQIALGANAAGEVFSNIRKSISLGNYDQPELRFPNYYDVIRNIIMAEYLLSGLSKASSMKLADSMTDDLAHYLGFCSKADAASLIEGEFHLVEYPACSEVRNAVRSTFMGVFKSCRENTSLFDAVVEI